MKTMRNFVAQRLSKKQMNDVKGGIKAHCYIWDENGNLLMDAYGPEGSDFIEERTRLQGIYGQFGYTVTCSEAGPAVPELPKISDLH